MITRKPKKFKQIEPTRVVKKTAPEIPKAVLNQVRDNMRGASRGLGSLYFEVRVVPGIPVLVGQPHIELAKMAATHGFRFEGDDLVLNTTKVDRCREDLAALQLGLVAKGYKVWRYRISEVMMDSNNFDTLSLL